MKPRQPERVGNVAAPFKVPIPAETILGDERRDRRGNLEQLQRCGRNDCLRIHHPLHARGIFFVCKKESQERTS